MERTPKDSLSTVGFVVPLPREETLCGENPGAQFPRQIDAIGRENPSTTQFVRSPEFRKRVKEGREQAGLGSSFLEDSSLFVTEMLAARGTRKMLTSQQYTVLEMRYVRGFSQLETAQILGKKDKVVSKIERRALLKIHNEKRGGNKEIAQAQTLLTDGLLGLDQIPGLTDREKEMLIGRCLDKKRNIQVARELGISERSASESYRAALQKAALFIRSFKDQQVQNGPSSQR